MSQRPPRPNVLIDALDTKPRQKFEGTVWRAIRDQRDPLLASRPGGRWDDGTFDVLYTATSQDGALAELYYHLSQGVPVFPSQVRFVAHEIAVTLDSVLDISKLSDLAELSLDIAHFGQLSYAERSREYPSTQQIAEVAHFLGYEAILAPSARSIHPNLVIFGQRVGPGKLVPIRSRGPIDWTAWKNATAKTNS